MRHHDTHCLQILRLNNCVDLRHKQFLKNALQQQETNQSPESIKAQERATKGQNPNDPVAKIERKWGDWWELVPLAAAENGKMWEILGWSENERDDHDERTADPGPRGADRVRIRFRERREGERGRFSSTFLERKSYCLSSDRGSNFGSLNRGFLSKRQHSHTHSLTL